MTLRLRWACVRLPSLVVERRQAGGTFQGWPSRPLLSERAAERFERERYGAPGQVERELHGSWLDAAEERYGASVKASA